MALIKCPECGKEISDKAPACPHCGYPIEKNVEIYNSEFKNYEEDNDEKDEEKSIEKEENKKIHINKKLVTVGIVAGIVVVCGVLIPIMNNSRNLKITDEGWTYIEKTDGKIYKDKISVNSDKKLVIFTENREQFIIEDGKGEIELSVKNDSEDVDKVAGIYEIKNEKDAGIEITTSEVNTEVEKYEALGEKSVDLEEEIQTEYDKPFLLYYHFENKDGDKITDTIMSDENPYEMITEAKTTIKEYLWDIPLDEETEYKFVIDGIVKFDTSDDFKVTLGDFKDEINTTIDERYEAKQEVSVEPNGAGILWCSITANGKDPQIQYCNIINGKGEIYWGDGDITDLSDAPELKYDFKWYTPSEYNTDFDFEIDKNAKKVTPSLKEVGERYENDFTVKLGEDGSYLLVDTNPSDIEDYASSTAWDYVLDINKMLGLPEALNQKMGTTRSIDGRLSETYGNITVSWTYHPDNGLEVLYEEKE